MRCIALILTLFSLSAMGEEFEIIPNVNLSPCNLSTQPIDTKFADQLNYLAQLEGRIIAPLTRHPTAGDHYLFVEIKKIRELAKTDRAEAERRAAAVIAKFKSWGVDL